MASAAASSKEEAEAFRLLQEAEKKMRGGKGVLGFFASASSRTDEAVDLYQRAANLFKMAKKWGSAGNAFVEAGDLQMTAENKHSAASSFVDASNCFKKVDPEEAVKCLNRAVDIHTEMGKFSMAAKHHISMAELFESQLRDLDKAIQHYQKAADYYSGEEAQSHANKCLLKVAEYAGEKEDYDKAISIYEQIAVKNAANQLLKHSARDYFFKALLCRLCFDSIGCEAAMNRYVDQYPALQDSREYKLIGELTAAIEDSNVDSYTKAVADFDKISRLDAWTTTMLLRAKKSLGEADLT